MQTVVREPEQRRQEVGDDPLRAGLDLDRHRHAGRQRIAIGERRVRSRNIEPCRDEIALQMAQFSIADRRI